MGQKFRAYVFLEPGKGEIRTFETPEITEERALLKVEACGICGTDKHYFQGHSPAAPFPFISGHEFIGTIVQLGKKASEGMAVFGGPLQEGDRVAVGPASLGCGTCPLCLTMPHRPALCPNRSVYGFSSTKKTPPYFGGFSEYICLYPKSYVFKLPKDMSLKRAVLTEPVAAALRAVERAYNPGEAFMGHGYGAGRIAMVLGAGPIGAMTVACLRYTGAGMIIAQDLFPGRLELAKKMGADVLIDGTQPLQKRLDEVRKLTNGLGPDVVIEAAGAPPAFQEALEFVRRGGKLIEVGHFTDNGTTAIHPFTICFKDVDIHGSWSYPAVIFRDAISFLERATLPVEDAVSHVLPLDDFQKGMDLTGAEKAGKIAIAP
jgi:threonine dehydrogenase-like Zn-dependent dehydrogenase